MVFAADYPFMDVLWTMIIFFCWVIWIWMLIVILTDVFRRRDIGGWAKAAWTVFLIVLPVPRRADLPDRPPRRDGRAQRQAGAGPQAQFDDYVRTVATKSVASGSAAAEIEKAKALLDNGTINQEEFEALKAKALA